MDIRMEENYDEKAGSLEIKAVSGDGEIMSSGMFLLRHVRFGGRYVQVLTLCGLETKPQFRRIGLVRKMMAEGEKFALQNGVSIAILHPFSFSYYRKFGYERVSDTLVISFPLSAISFVPYFRDMKPLTTDLVPAYIEYFDAFSKNRNLIFRQYADNIDLKGTYVLLEGDKITGHVKLDNLKHFDGVNRCDPDGLFLRQLGFLSPDALTKVLGFLRMFEGEQEKVTVCDAGPLPELDSFLKNYMHTEYVLRPDIMAKVLDTEKALSMARYRPGSGRFTLRVNDGDPGIGGTFSVEVDGDGGCKVKRVDGENACPDIILSPQALSKLIFGYDSYDPDTAAYLPGVTVTDTSYKVLDAFPKQINGWFEHF